MEFSDVSVDFGTPPVRVVDGVSLAIEAGEFVSLVGPSGCGKSTLLRLMSGLLCPSQGTIARRRLTDLPSDQQPHDVSFVFQHPNLLPWRNVLDNVGLPRELENAPAKLIRQEAIAACRLVGLDDYDQRKLPKMLSGGMQMRVSFARALVTRPALMLMDEPFAAVDDILRYQLNLDVLRLWRELRWSCVFVTHHLNEALFLAQRIVIMSGKPGRIVRDLVIPFDYPRDRKLRTSLEFVRLLDEVDSTMRGDA